MPNEIVSLGNNPPTGQQIAGMSAQEFFLLYPELWDEAAYLEAAHPGADPNSDKGLVNRSRKTGGTDPWANTWGAPGLTHFIRHGYAAGYEVQPLTAPNASTPKPQGNHESYGFDLGLFNVRSGAPGHEGELIESKARNALMQGGKPLGELFPELTQQITNAIPDELIRKNIEIHRQARIEQTRQEGIAGAGQRAPSQGAFSAADRDFTRGSEGALANAIGLQNVYEQSQLAGLNSQSDAIGRAAGIPLQQMQGAAGLTGAPKASLAEILMLGALAPPGVGLAVGLLGNNPIPANDGRGLTFHQNQGRQMALANLIAGGTQNTPNNPGYGVSAAQASALLNNPGYGVTPPVTPPAAMPAQPISAGGSNYTVPGGNFPAANSQNAAGPVGPGGTPGLAELADLIGQARTTQQAQVAPSAAGAAALLNNPGYGVPAPEVRAVTPPPIGGSFYSHSRYKENRRPEPHGMLDAVKALAIERWNYRDGMQAMENVLPSSDDDHIGPMAEDWQKKIGLGDGETISVIDFMGVTLKAMQELASEVEDLRKEIHYGKK